MTILERDELNSLFFRLWTSRIKGTKDARITAKEMRACFRRAMQDITKALREIRADQERRYRIAYAVARKAFSQIARSSKEKPCRDS